jgi:hypothetical protein
MKWRGVMRAKGWEPRPPRRGLPEGRGSRGWDAASPRAISNVDPSVAFLVGWEPIKATTGCAQRSSFRRGPAGLPAACRAVAALTAG